jgi:hypothetical protein
VVETVVHLALQLLQQQVEQTPEAAAVVDIHQLAAQAAPALSF